MIVNKLNFAHLPTPIEELPRLTNHLQGPTLLVKRDDLTGLAFGGNKTRKLEFLLADAQAHNSNLLITGGAAQSNHCRQTAAAAARFGFECVLVLSGVPPQHASANILIDNLVGASIVWDSGDDREYALNNEYIKAKKNGFRPYLIPYGGSNPIGASAYAYAIQEFIQQTQKMNVRKPIDWIVFASSSGGTQAGMVVGATISGFTGKILGISVDEPEEALKERVSRLAAETVSFLDKDLSIPDNSIIINSNYCKAGYGILTAAEKKAIHLFASWEGLLLDPVYTGRAAAGLIDLIQGGFFHKDETVLFWHTGGQPALFSDRYQADIL